MLPLIFNPGDSIDSLGLTGEELFFIAGLDDMTPRRKLEVKAVSPDGSSREFTVISRLDTEVDVTYFRHGGILPYVLRQMMA